MNKQIIFFLSFLIVANSNSQYTECRPFLRKFHYYIYWHVEKPTTPSGEIRTWQVPKERKNQYKSTQKIYDKEHNVAFVLARHGYNFRFLEITNPNPIPNRIKGATNPDIEVEGRIFEIYTPDSSNLKTVTGYLYSKSKNQSSRIILDLSNSELKTEDFTNLDPNTRNRIGRYVNEIIIIKDGVITEHLLKDLRPVMKQ